MKHLTAEPDLQVLEEPFRGIVEKALTKDPERRLRSVNELVALLPGPPQGSFRATPFPATNVASSSEASVAASVAAPVLRPISSPHKGRRSAEPGTGAASDEEPIYRAVRHGAGNIRQEWRRAKLHPILKMVVLVIGFFAILSNSTFLAPLIVVTFAAYCIYWVLRAVASHPPSTSEDRSSAERPATESPAAYAAAAGPDPSASASPGGGWRRGNRRPYGHRRRWQQAAQEMLAQKTWRQKMTELTGSMLLSSAIVVTMSVVMMLLRGGEMQVEQFVWLLLVATLGAWSIMTSSKLWEGKRGDQAPRRFTMLVVGLALGAAASGVTDMLIVELPHNRDFGVLGPASFIRLYDEGGRPIFYAFLAYFGFLFLLVRWWRLADPLRATRLSIWSTVWCVLLAWILSFFWPFPQPWGLMVAATMAVAIQLASPWIASDKRKLEWSEA